MTVGMYGGKFFPLLHLGHVYAMKKAYEMVDELHIIVSYDEKHEKDVLNKSSKVKYVDPTTRVRWWSMITRGLKNIYIHKVYEEQTGNLSDWKSGADKIKEKVSKEINVVFSSEHDYTPIFSSLYPNAEHVVIDSKRKNFNISGTEIRKYGVYKNWGMIPDVIKPYFTKKIAIVGTESVGKSTLTKKLAEFYNTNYVEEYGRTVCENLGGCDGIINEDDFREIVYGHKLLEYENIKHSNKILFIDSEAVVSQYYSILYLSKSCNWIDDVIASQNYDLYIYLEPDVTWVEDGYRVHGEKRIRETNNELLKSMFDKRGIECASVSGSYDERLTKSIMEINKLF